MGSSSRSPLGDKTFSSKYSERLSPAINQYLLEAARQEVGVCISSNDHVMFSKCMSFHNSLHFQFAEHECLIDAAPGNT